MKRSRIHVNLIASIDRIMEQLEDALSSEKEISLIQLDILKQSTRNFYLILDELAQLQSQNIRHSIESRHDALLARRNIVKNNDSPKDEKQEQTTENVTSNQPFFLDKNEVILQITPLFSDESDDFIPQSVEFDFQATIKEESIPEEPIQEDIIREEIIYENSIQEEYIETEIASLENSTELQNENIFDIFETDSNTTKITEQETAETLRETENQRRFIAEFGEPELFVASMAKLSPTKGNENSSINHLVDRLKGMNDSDKREKNNEQDTKNPLDIFSSLQTIADKYKTSSHTVHDQMASEQNNSFFNFAAEKSPINDLKSAIGINEKFLFINELFRGNMKECTDLILQLNEAGSIEKAYTILQPVKDKYQWEDDALAYVTLTDFLRRRFQA